MLLLSDKLQNVPIMSLQTGAELARTQDLIIDPRNLKIIAVSVAGPTLESNPSVLHMSDIREVSDIGYIVDDSNALMSTEGLVRLQEVIGFHFELIGTQVKDRHDNKLGKVSDFAYDPTSFNIMQIHTAQSLLKSLATASNIVHRNQILSVTNECIVVDIATIKDKIVENAQHARLMVNNPFRVTQPEPTNRRSTPS